MTTWTATDEDSDLRHAAASTLLQRTAEIVATLHTELGTVEGVPGIAELSEAFGRFAGSAVHALSKPAAHQLPHRGSEVMERVHAAVRQLALQRCYPLIVTVMMLRALRDLQRAVDAHQVTVSLLDAG